MKILNSKWLFLAILAAFVWLCWYSYNHKPDTLITYPAKPAAEQMGYDKRDVKKLGRFIAKRVAEMNYVQQHAADLTALFGE